MIISQPPMNLHYWNTIISRYSKTQQYSSVFRLFRRMRKECKGVDSFNLVFAIKACIGLSRLKDGKSVHCLVVKSGLGGDGYVSPALVKVYVELGSIHNARQVFDQMPEQSSLLYGVMMKGYLKISKDFEVFWLFRKMNTLGLKLDALTLEGLVRACGNICGVGEGKTFHGLGIKLNLTSPGNVFLHTSLVDMYMKCGLVDFADKLCEEVDGKDVVLWTSMISGFSRNGRGAEAMSLFRKMIGESISPNSYTLAAIVHTCSSIESLNQGKSVHCYMIRNLINIDVVNYTSFIDMYSKCGCLTTALRVFNVVPEKNVFSWSAMINAFGTHGSFAKAVHFFTQMRMEKIWPNSVTFISILSACSHCGKVEEGWKYFNSMSRDYGIVPIEEHYACMVDLLGRCGRIDEALSFINSMPLKPSASAWGALLCACRIYKRVDLAEQVARQLCLPL